MASRHLVLLRSAVSVEVQVVASESRAHLVVHLLRASAVLQVAGPGHRSDIRTPFFVTVTVIVVWVQVGACSFEGTPEAHFVEKAECSDRGKCYPLYCYPPMFHQ